MFTWICPQCGREVPPSYSECPTCAENRARGVAPGAPQQAQPPAQYPPQQYPQQAPPQPQYQPPPQTPQYASQPLTPPMPPPPPMPQAPPPQQTQYAPHPQYAAPPPQYAPPAPPPQPPPAWEQPQAQHSQAYYTVGEQPKKKLPGWLVALGTFALLGVALFGLYSFMRTDKSGASAAQTKKAESATPPGTHPYAKFLELTGLRISEEGKKVKVQFVVINHSAAALAGVELKVTLTTINAKPEDAPLGEFTSKVGEVEPFGSKDVTESFTTKLRAYELPDWQFLKATFEITAPH